MEPIDFVVTYLDSDDPKWHRDRAVHMSGNVDQSQNSAARYRNLDTFRFWFRSVEKFAPWVRKIHFVTFGHHPEWLDVNHPKLNIVNHDSFLPREHLPTFSSRAIELNLDRIPGLSERFVSFNDDMFLTAPTEPSDFFRGNLPVLRTQYLPCIPDERWSAVLFWNSLAVNQVCPDIGVSLRRALSLRTDLKGLLSNIWLAPLLLKAKRHFGFHQDHLALPLTRTAMKTLRARLPDEFERATSSRFRSIETVNIWFVADYMRARGEYVPRRRSFGKYVELGATEDYSNVVNSRWKIVCVNDGNMAIDFAREKMALHHALTSLLPQGSQFELR